MRTPKDPFQNAWIWLYHHIIHINGWTWTESPVVR